MSGASKSTTTASPWKIQIDPLKAGFAQAGHLLDKSKTAKYYGGDTLAGFTSPEKQAQKGIQHYATGDAVKKMGRDARSQLSKTYGLANRLGTQATGYGAGAVKDAQRRAGEVGAYGSNLMGYGNQATKYGLTQGDYAGMTPFQGQQLSDMLAGKVNTGQLGAVTSAMGRDIMDTLSAPGGMLSQIRGQQVGYQPEELHHWCKHHFNIETTSEFTKDEFSEFIDRVILWAAEQGYPVKGPRSTRLP